jgi:hypothetical protein
VSEPQESTAQEVIAPPLPDGSRQRNHIPQNLLGAILRLHAEGKPQTAIAQFLGVSQPAISKALSRLGADTTDLARHHFKSRAYKTSRRLTAIAEKGKDGDAVKAGKVVLEAAGVISSMNSSIQLGIQVIIGGESQPAIGAGSVQVEALDTTLAPQQDA